MPLADPVFITELTLAAVIIAAFVRCLLGLNRFLATVPSISDEVAFDKFKTLARVNMYLAIATIIASIGILGSMVVLWMQYGPAGYLAIVVGGGLAMIAGLGGPCLKSREKAVQSLPTRDDQMQREVDSVSHCWRRRPFPNF
jgi:hypothetical protein